MIIIGSCVGDSGERFDAVTRPTLQGILGPDDLIAIESGSHGICAAYNSIIELARSRTDCELLVLMHDDVGVVDSNFRAKLLVGAAIPHAGVLGVVGGSGLRSIEWWGARTTAGAVFESRGFLDLGPRHAEVDCVDGLLMALTPGAFQSLTFDELSFPKFHGYDLDFCFLARASGFSNYVLPVDIIHRTKGGYGDEVEFAAAASALVSKWPQFVKAEPRLSRTAAGAEARARRVARGAVRRIRENSPRMFQHEAQPRLPHRGDAPAGSPATVSPVEFSQPVPPSLFCPVCADWFVVSSHEGVVTAVWQCPRCGLGISWPPPSRDVVADGLWQERYGGSRLERRDTSFRESQSRIDWVKLLVPDGMVLEVGCGTGEFVVTAQNNGFESCGVEPSKWAAERAREIGGDVVTGYVNDWSSTHPNIRPDAVALWHVLEHVPDPSGFLKEVHALLRTGGRVFIEVPNYASTDAKRLGNRWDGLQPQDHFHHFGPRSLRLLLEGQGFDVEHLLEISPRIYLSSSRWNEAKNSALLEGRPWPSLDYLRVSAIVR